MCVSPELRFGYRAATTAKYPPRVAGGIGEPARDHSVPTRPPIKKNFSICICPRSKMVSVLQKIQKEPEGVAWVHNYFQAGNRIVRQHAGALKYGQNNN